MKKNITINLCGRLYQIDEDAYELLSQYTETLRNYFLKQEDGKEIADDIEERIAELLDELKAQGFLFRGDFLHTANLHDDFLYLFNGDSLKALCLQFVQQFSDTFLNIVGNLLAILLLQEVVA